MLARDYWEGNFDPQLIHKKGLTTEERNQLIDKYFFVVWVLIESSIHDYCVGKKTRKNNQLNWAVTNYYYSLVHTFRCICLMATGTYPTWHSELVKVFSYFSTRNFRDRNTVLFEGNWIKEFLKDDYSKIKSKICQKNISPQGIKDFFGIPVELYNQFGLILNSAKDCRNDSNYEGLLITHEHNHALVTESFEELAQIMESVASRIISDLLQYLKIFMKELSPRSEYWWYFLIIDRIPYFRAALEKQSIRDQDYIDFLSKITLDSDLIMKMEVMNQTQNCSESIDIMTIDSKSMIENDPRIKDKVEEVKSNVSRKIFHSKRTLMQNFEDKVRKLKDQLEEFDEYRKKA